jgi:hypothetical protein
MAFTLYTGQILEALRAIKDPMADGYIASLESLTERAGKRLADALDIAHGNLSNLWDSNAAMTFSPKHDGQALPDALEGMDADSEWDITERR